jgi:probable F420-dependent oxidoreductase
MKFGLRYCNTGRYVDAHQAIELARTAEEVGFESLWTVEHTVVPAGYESAYPYSNDGKMAGGANDFPLPDPLIWLTYVAAVTSRIKLATGVFILPQHNPVVAAKQLASIDHLSGGRMLLGIGVGWLKEEFDVLGARFDERGARTDEYVAAMRCLWHDDAPTFRGQFVRFEGAYCRPQPINRTIPIIVGGHSHAAAQRAGRIGDGFFPARGASTELIDIVRRSAESAGRDASSIEITVTIPDDLAEIPRLAKLGVARVLVPVVPMLGMNQSFVGTKDAARWRDVIETYA